MVNAGIITPGTSNNLNWTSSTLVTIPSNYIITKVIVCNKRQEMAQRRDIADIFLSDNSLGDIEGFLNGFFQINLIVGNEEVKLQANGNLKAVKDSIDSSKLIFNEEGACGEVCWNLLNDYSITSEATIQINIVSNNTWLEGGSNLGYFIEYIPSSMNNFNEVFASELQNTINCPFENYYLQPSIKYVSDRSFSLRAYRFNCSITHDSYNYSESWYNSLSWQQNALKNEGYNIGDYVGADMPISSLNSRNSSKRKWLIFLVIVDGFGNLGRSSIDDIISEPLTTFSSNTQINRDSMIPLKNGLEIMYNIIYGNSLNLQLPNQYETIKTTDIETYIQCFNSLLESEEDYIQAPLQNELIDHELLGIISDTLWEGGFSQQDNSLVTILE